MVFEISPVGSANITTSRTPDAPTPRPRQTTNEFDPAAPTILVVDDELLLRRTVALILRRFGYRAFDVAGGIAARQSVQDGGRIDLVLTDLEMSPLDGVELIGWLHTEHPRLRTVAMTGSFGWRNQLLHRFHDAVVLLKPFTPEQLHRVIELVLAREPVPRHDRNGRPRRGDALPSLREEMLRPLQFRARTLART